MKLFLILLIILNLNSFASSELQWVDEQIEAIKPPRIGVSDELLKSLKNPFIFLNSENISISEKKGTTREKKSYTTKKVYSKSKKPKRKPKIYYTDKNFTLNAIMNRSALINSQWYKIGAKVLGYTVYSIKAQSVILKRKNRQIILSTKSDIKNLNFNK